LGLQLPAQSSQLSEDGLATAFIFSVHCCSFGEISFVVPDPAFNHAHEVEKRSE
jgi:hypothetical protein